MATADSGPRYGSLDGVRDLLSRAGAQSGGQGGGDPDEEDTAAALSDATLTRRLNTAANQVDAALAPYYRTPFDEPPGLVVDLVEAIGAYLADLTHRQSTDLAEDDPVRLRYEWALDQLRGIAAGDVVLPGADRLPSSWAGNGAIAGPPRNTTDAAMFTLGGFGLEIDQARVITSPEARGARRRGPRR